MEVIKDHTELRVFKIALKAALEIHEISNSFPKEEKYALTDQIRRSSRSVCANLAEAFRKRRYPRSFIAKLSDCEGEAAETQVWLLFAKELGYIEESTWLEVKDEYDNILAKLVLMINNPEKWRRGE